MALASADIAELDRLGPVLCRLGHERVNLTWQSRRGGQGGYYFADGRDALGRFFSGYGDTPSEALACAQRALSRDASGGIYLDA